MSEFVENLGTDDAVFEVVVRQGRLLTLKESLVSPDQPSPIIALGDPNVIDFEVLNSRQLRIIGQKIGVTDLAITTGSGKTYSFLVQVVADLPVLRGQLKQLFPDASLRLSQIRDHVVVEGQARDSRQVAQILQTIQAYLRSVQNSQAGSLSGGNAPPGAGPPGAAPPDAAPPRAAPPGAAPPGAAPAPGVAASGAEAPRDDRWTRAAMQAAPGAAPVPGDGPVPGGTSPSTSVRMEGSLQEIGGVISTVQGSTTSEIINLIRVPGSQQVLLKVRVAELNRSGLRRIGADILAQIPEFGALLGTRIGGAGVNATSTLTGRAFDAAATSSLGATNTVFGIFPEANFEILLTALRQNSLLKILAEPNLVALNGHPASFLAGGEFPVPVPQSSGGVGLAPTITVQFREFGVRLGFLPFILDNDVIRLTVDPEVSSIDFSIGTTLVAGGSIVPGLNTRRSHTTVELRQGQTLAIAGLLQLSLDGTTTRIPGLGDLPILGPFFSNTSSNRVEKELVVLVTPYLVEPMNPDQVPPGPGDEVKAPNDLELYFLNRIEGRTGTDYRATTTYDDPLHVVRHLILEKKVVRGPFGFSD